MAENAQDAGGIMDSVRRFGRSLLGLVRTRIELFAVELQEQKLRTLSLMAWFAAAVALGVAGLLVLTGVLALLLWQSAGYLGLGGLALALLGGAAVILRWIHHRIQHAPMPFAETIAEFRRDAENLRSRE